MPKMDFGKSSFSFGGTTYECLNNWSWSGSVQDLVSQCSASTGATTVRRAGTPDDTFTFDVVVDEQDVTTINALKRGESGAFEAHPEGDDADNVEFTATNAIITSSNLGGSPNAMGIYSITIGIDGALTVQAAV